MTEPTLEVCPFCDNSASITVVSNERKSIQRHKIYYIKCLNCGAHSDAYFDCNQAMGAWNTRANDRKYENLLSLIKEGADKGLFTVSKFCMEILKDLGELK